jgi:integrase
MTTIQRRLAKGGTVSYRVRVQRRGYPVQSATFANKADALRYGQMIEGQIAEGRHFPTKPQPLTLAELLVKYMAECLPRKAPSTQHDDQWYLNYWKKTLGHKLIADITPRDLCQCRDALLKTHKASSVIRILRVLSAVLTAAVKEFEVLDTNPMSKVKMPPQPEGRVRYLRGAERERLLDACQASSNGHLYPLVLCALSTGVREGELLRLRWCDVNLDAGVLHIEKSKTKRRRDVPITGKALEVLRHISLLQPVAATDYVFPATNRKAPFRSYRKAWEFARKRAQIEDYRFYDNRHTTASYLAQQGVSLYTIGNILGHVSPTTTAIYAHLATDTLRDALEVMTRHIF